MQKSFLPLLQLLGQALISYEALRWQGYDLSGTPKSCHPPDGATGKRSYTIRFDDNRISIDVLRRQRAFFCKEASEAQRSLDMEFLCENFSPNLKVHSTLTNPTPT